MALTEQEKQAVKELKQKGFSNVEIAGFVGGQRTGNPSSIRQKLETAENEEDVKPEPDHMGRFQETKQDIKQTIGGVKQAFSTVGEEAQQAVDQTRRGEIAPGQGALRFLGAGAKAGSQAFGELFKGGVKALFTQEGEDQAKDLIGKAGKLLMESKGAQDLQRKWEALPEEDKKDLGAIFNIGAFATDVVGTGQVFQQTRKGFQASREAFREAARQAKSVDDVFRMADEITPEAPGQKPSTQDFPDTPAVKREALPTQDFPDTPAGRRAKAEAEAPELNFEERYINLDPARKKQIQNIPKEKVADYIHHTKTANLDVNTPSIASFAGENVEDTVRQVENVLNDSGSSIGRTRQKFATVEAPQPKIQQVEDVFRNQLDKNKLTIKKGKVVRVKGKPSANISQGDINALNDLYRDLLAVKQSPKLENLVDLRFNFDERVNFGKRAAEVSNSVDPIARNTRKEIAQVMRDIVGAENASEVARYANVAEELKKIRSFTDRRAGGEYLVRLALSGRGREARDAIGAIKEITGVNLMDDAILLAEMMDRFANRNQRTLFRQQLEQAGVSTVEDLIGAARGDIGKLGNLYRRGMDRLIDEEDVLTNIPKN